MFILTATGVQSFAELFVKHPEQPYIYVAEDGCFTQDIEEIKQHITDHKLPSRVERYERSDIFIQCDTPEVSPAMRAAMKHSDEQYAQFCRNS